MLPSFLRSRSRVVWLVAVVFLVVLDQSSKSWFASTIPLGSVIEVTNWFNLVHYRNAGAAFSFLADASGWQRWFFVVVGLMVVIPLGFLCLTWRMKPMERLAGTLIVAGGCGNLVDRIDTGAVTDFLDFHWRGVHWPAFNLADVWIVIGMAVWLWVSWLPAHKKETTA